MKGLNRPEGEIQDIDDIQGIFEGNDDDDEHELDETQRSVKVMLRSKFAEFFLFTDLYY